MLQGIRVVTQNWVGRLILTLVMGVLILSFAIWGIGDMVRGFRNDNVGQVGAVTLTGDQVRAAYQNELTRLQRQLQRAINNDQARQLGVDRNVVRRMVDESLLDQQVKKFGLTISDAAIATALRDDPTFKDASGAFDRARFDAAIRDAGFNEQSFVLKQREVYTRREIGEALVGDLVAPNALLAAIARYRDETRALEVATLPPAAAGDIPAPTDAELTSFFEARKADYRAPAYRKISLLVVTPAEIAKPADVPAADVARYYEAQKDKFGAPEKRRILQIVYQTEDEAKAAAAKLAAGETFDALLADKKLKEADVDLGLKTKSEIFDKAIAQAGFALAPGATSGVVKGEFGYAILKAAEVIPAQTKPLTAVEGEIRQELALKGAADKIRDLRDKIEDQRASGKPLGEAAKAVGLSIRVIDAVDAQGLDAKGEKVAGLPEPDHLLRAVFASDVGVDNDVISLKDRGYAWFDVLGVTPSRDRTLAEVKDKVASAWKARQTADRLRKKADAVIAAIKAGKTLEELAKADNLEVKRFDGVRREGAVSGLARGAVVQAYNLKVGEAGSAEAGDGARAVFVTLSSTVPPFDPKAAASAELARTLSPQLTSDIVSEYVAALRANAKVTLDQPAIDRALFGSGDN